MVPQWRAIRLLLIEGRLSNITLSLPVQYFRHPPAFSEFHRLHAHPSCPITDILHTLASTHAVLIFKRSFFNSVEFENLWVLHPIDFKFFSTPGYNYVMNIIKRFQRASVLSKQSGRFKRKFEPKWLNFCFKRFRSTNQTMDTFLFKFILEEFV